MEPKPCHYCTKEIPKGQSFYEGHQTQVCLACYQTCKPCGHCGFPTKTLENHPTLGKVCSFCVAENPVVSEGSCHLCHGEITSGERNYADHGVKVCLHCFNTAKSRCFTCRFPKSTVILDGQGGVCEFCSGHLVDRRTDLGTLLAPLKPFLAAFNHHVFLPPTVVFLDWRVVLGMQREEAPKYEVNFLDELVHWAYPVYHLDQKLYSAVAMPAQWFLPLAAGQLAAKDLCQKFGEPHLGKEGGKFHFPRAYVHFLTYFTAARLGYSDVAKKLLRWPEVYTGPEFEELVQTNKKLGVKGVIRVANKRFAEQGKGW